MVGPTYGVRWMDAYNATDDPTPGGGRGGGEGRGGEHIRHVALFAAEIAKARRLGLALEIEAEAARTEFAFRRFEAIKGAIQGAIQGAA